MAQATSKSREIIKTLDRETLEAALFVAAALIRSMAKGEMPPPPATADRTAVTINLIQMAQILIGPVDKEIEVTDVSQAADILNQISHNKGAN